MSSHQRVFRNKCSHAVILYFYMMSELLSEHQNVLVCVKGLQEQRDKLNQEVSSKDNRAKASEFERNLYFVEIGSTARAHFGGQCVVGLVDTTTCGAVAKVAEKTSILSLFSGKWTLRAQTNQCW